MCSNKTLITFNRTMLKVLWRILFMMILFSSSCLYKRIQVYYVFESLCISYWTIHNFILIVFSLPYSSAPSSNLVSSHDGCQEGGLHVSKERGDEKRKGGLIHLSALWQYTLKHYSLTLKHYCFFFLFSHLLTCKNSTILGCHAIGINSSRFSNFICQAKSLIWIIVSDYLHHNWYCWGKNTHSFTNKC